MTARLNTLLALLALSTAGAGCGSLGPDSDGEGGNGNGGDGDKGDDPSGLSACKKIDLVISVDNSGSMQEEKQAMRDVVFPAMAERLLSISTGLDDFRVGVLDACPNPASFHTRGQSGSCNFSSGEPWMVHDAPELVDEFQCVGDIDSSNTSCTGQNDDEQPASTIAAALSGAMAGTGFLRDDALLVAIAITDEDEQPTPDASAQEVYDRLVAVKGGNVNRIVFLGVGGSSDCNGVYGSADHAVKLEKTANLFANEGQGLFWDLCDGNLEDGLEAVMSTIESACDDFCNDPDGCEPGDPGEGECNDPDGCEPGDPGEPECTENSDCGASETCDNGYCKPVID